MGWMSWKKARRIEHLLQSASRMKQCQRMKECLIEMSYR
jgi:hypothetical protein